MVEPSRQAQSFCVPRGHPRGLIWGAGRSVPLFPLLRIYPERMQALGRQILVEFYDCAPVLNDEPCIRTILLEGVRRSGATIVSETFHTFSPHGVSGVIVIAESHVAIHTWPEYGYAAVDIFTCGETIDPWVIHRHLEEEFEAESTSSMEMKRGLFPGRVRHKPEALLAMDEEAA